MLSDSPNRGENNKAAIRNIHQLQIVKDKYDQSHQEVNKKCVCTMYLGSLCSSWVTLEEWLYCTLLVAHCLLSSPHLRCLCAPNVQ